MRITGDTTRLNKSRKSPLWGGRECGVDDPIVKENSALAAAGADGALVRLSPVDVPAVRAVPIVYIGGFVDIDVKLGAGVIGTSLGVWL
jgi:hypothetical protein